MTATKEKKAILSDLASLIEEAIWSEESEDCIFHLNNLSSFIELCVSKKNPIQEGTNAFQVINEHLRDIFKESQDFSNRARMIIGL